MQQLSRRERQIMEVIYQLGKATASEVQASMDNPPSYSAVRTHLRILKEKGLVQYEKSGTQYVYYPLVSPEKAKKSAIKHLLRTFFAGSAESAFASLLEISQNDLTEADYQRFKHMIDQAKQEKR